MTIRVLVADDQGMVRSGFSILLNAQAVTVPTLSPGMLLLLGVALALTSLLLVRRS